MKRSLAPTTLVVVFAVFSTVFVLGISPKAQAGEPRGCSNASLRGSFGFTNTGTNLALPPPFAGPIAQIGRQTFDGRGHTRATTTLSANGNIFGATAEGSYVVNPDCTGSLTLYVSPVGSTVNADFVLDDDGAEIRALITDEGAIESIVFKKQFPGDRRE
jgi:hypothetical protein